MFPLGWITVSAWCFACAGPTSLLANITLSLAMFNHENYTPESWHTSLVMIAAIVLPLACNLWFRRMLNFLETFGGVLHVCLLIAFIAVLAGRGQKSDESFVFGTLVTDRSGWTNPGVSWSLGLLTVTFSLSGLDSVIHMSMYEPLGTIATTC